MNKNNTVHLYMIVFPNNALVASQLDPDQFAEHYTIGSAKHHEGKVIFAEIDPQFRDPYFDIDHYVSLTVPHNDGSPKKTKYVSSYSVLEHIKLAAIKSLYLVTVNGKALELKSKPYTAQNEPGLVRLYQEITPLSNLVASTLDQRAFGKYITTGTKSKGAPKVFFTQYEFDIAAFLKTTKHGNIKLSPIPDTNLNRLLEYLTELEHQPDKKTKTINLISTLSKVSYKIIRHGFWFAGPDEFLFFPMPSIAKLEHDHYDWWRFAH
ncbi:MAG TPA: hypothetical protein DEB40_13615 [Elusimicrobia bacterium]|nr:hypothetical protein [Elusimicrobiota bacterium]HBT62772.1 hypothetical protein [Elusimicrobiota bacterium]